MFPACFFDRQRSLPSYARRLLPTYGRASPATSSQKYGSIEEGAVWPICTIFRETHACHKDLYVRLSEEELDAYLAENLRLLVAGSRS